MSTKPLNRTFVIIIAVFAFFQYVNTFSNDFAWDDKIVIQENTRVQEGISGIPDLFKKYSSDLREDKYGYRPITLTTFAIEYSLFGENPAGFHFMNAIYFAILCLVIFIVLRRIFESVQPVLLFVIAMLFAAHPIHVEAVANIKSRDEILAMLFGLLSVYQFLKFYTKGSWKHLFIGVLLFVFAFLSRENAITFIAVIPLALLVHKKVEWKPFLKSVLALPVLLLIAFLILNYSMNSQLGQEKTAGFGIYEESHLLGNSFVETAHFGDKVANAFHLIWIYTKKFFIPHPLTYYSGFDHVPLVRGGWQVITGFIITLALLVVSIWRFRKNPLIAFGALFTLITLSVYLHVFQSLSDTYADRFMFIPSLGFMCLFVGILNLIIKPIDTEAIPVKFKQLSTPFKTVAIGVFILFTVLTFSRNRVWKDDFTLISNDLPHLENCARAHYYYASELNLQLSNGKWSKQKEDDMIHHYERSFEISDSIYYGRLELATYYLNQGNFSKGVPILNRMTELFPQTSDPHHFLGQTFVGLEEYDKAIPHLERSIELATKSHDSYYLLAVAYSKEGQSEKGIRLAESGLEKFPEAAASMYEAMGHIYYDMDELQKSTEKTLMMIQHGADPYTVYATIIGRYQSKGDEQHAAQYYQSAVQQGFMRAQ